MPNKEQVVVVDIQITIPIVAPPEPPLPSPLSFYSDREAEDMIIARNNWKREYMNPELDEIYGQLDNVLDEYEIIYERVE